MTPFDAEAWPAFLDFISVRDNSTGVLTRLPDDQRAAAIRFGLPFSINDPVDDPAPDNLVSELLDLAQQNDEPAFRALAACSMPPDEITPCWLGTRSRLGFPSA